MGLVFEGLSSGGTTRPQAKPLEVLLFNSIGMVLGKRVYGPFRAIIYTKTTQ